MSHFKNCITACVNERILYIHPSDFRAKNEINGNLWVVGWNKRLLFSFANICFGGRKFSAFFIKNNFKRKNPVEQRYQILLILWLLFFSHWISRWFFHSHKYFIFGLQRQQQIITTKSYTIRSSWSAKTKIHQIG